MHPLYSQSTELGINCKHSVLVSRLSRVLNVSLSHGLIKLTFMTVHLFSAVSFRECPITAIMLFCYYSSANSTTIFSQGISSSLPFIPGNWYRRWLVRILMPMNGRCPRGVCVVLSFNEAKWKSIDCKNRFGFYDFWAHANLNITTSSLQNRSCHWLPLRTHHSSIVGGLVSVLCSLDICGQIHPIGGWLYDKRSTRSVLNANCQLIFSVWIIQLLAIISLYNDIE